MANIKSAQKRVRQDEVRRQQNLGRKTALKTAVKKVIAALEGGDIDQAKALLKDAEAQLARAAGKGVIHHKTAQRKTSRIALRVAKAAGTKKEAKAVVS